MEGATRFWPSGFRVYPILAIAQFLLRYPLPPWYLEADHLLLVPRVLLIYIYTYICEDIPYVEVCRGRALPVGSKAKIRGHRFHTWYLVPGRKQGTKSPGKSYFLSFAIFTCSWHLVPGIHFSQSLLLLSMLFVAFSQQQKKKNQLLRRPPGPLYIHAHIMALWGVSPC